MAVPHRSKPEGRRRDAVRKRTALTRDPPPEVELDPRHLNTVDLAAVRQQVTNLVANRALEVVHKILDQIERGNYQAMKYLLEMVGLFPAATPEETPAGDSLAKTLLNYLGISQEPFSRSEAAQRDRGEQVQADAVK